MPPKIIIKITLEKMSGLIWALLIILLILTIVLIAVAMSQGKKAAKKDKSCCAPVCCNPHTTINVGVTPAGMAVDGCCGFGYVANNNNYLTSTGMDSVSVVNLQKNLVVDTIYHSSFNQPFTATLDQKRNLVYITNSNSTTVSLIDTDTRHVVGIIDGFDGPSGLVISKDGLTAYVNNYGGPAGVGSGNGTTISVVDLTTLSITDTITVDLAPIAMALGLCGDLLYSISYVDGLPGTGTMQVIDLSTNLVTATVTGFSGPFGIDVSKKNAYVTNFGSNNFAPYGTSVSVVNLASLTISHTVENVGIQPSGVVVYKSRVYVTNYNSLYNGPTLMTGQGTVSVIDADTNKLLPITYQVDQAPANITAANGRLYVSCWTGNTVSVIAI